MSIDVQQRKFQQIAEDYYDNLFSELILEYAEQIKEYQKRELVKTKEIVRLKDEFVFRLVPLRMF